MEERPAETAAALKDFFWGCHSGKSAIVKVEGQVKGLGHRAAKAALAHT